jgi:predicted Zn-dependent peptidase
MRPIVTTFHDGLRLVVIPVPESPTVTALVLVGAGSKYEQKSENGISHFLEHMCFKGTVKRPRSIDISRELDSVGAQYNAFTSQEFTGYYAKAAYAQAGMVIDVVADIYNNSTFPVAEIEKEKGVIIEEINMYQDLPQRHVHDVFMDLLYGDQPAGWNIAGTKETVSSFSRNDFISYHEKHYVSGSTVVVVSGKVDPADISTMVRDAFSGIRAGSQSAKLTVVENQHSPGIRLVHRASDQVHMVVGVRSFGVHDKRNSALKVLTAILGGGMSSRLFEKLRNELGLCYYVSASADGYSDHGSLDVSAGVDVKRAPLAVEAICHELQLLTKDRVADTEMKKARDYLIGSLFISLETSEALADYYGYNEILGRPRKTPEEVALEISSVTADDVLSVARDIVRPDRLNLALVGPCTDEQVFSAVLKV